MVEPDLALFASRPEGVVFDCDGLLVDTEPCWTVAESAVFAARGLPYGTKEKALFIGKSVPATVELMAGLFGEVGNDDAIYAEVMGTVGDVILGQAEPMPGALELVRALSGRMPIGVASNSPRVILDITLQRAGLTGAFGAVIAADAAISAAALVIIRTRDLVKAPSLLVTCRMIYSSVAATNYPGPG